MFSLMDFMTLFFLAFGLSMDAFAVSVTDGMCYRDIQKKNYFQIALTFGLFQSAMPVIGFFAGKMFSEAIESADHWVAFILLAAIGASMIFEAVKEMRNPESCDFVKLTFKALIIQGVATSIDALAVGVGLAVIDTNIIYAASFIGFLTFIICVIGVAVGKKAGGFLKTKAQITGGCILIFIGIKILIEHMFL